MEAFLPFNTPTHHKHTVHGSKEKKEEERKETKRGKKRERKFGHRIQYTDLR
jgi:hypothetical protein